MATNHSYWIVSPNVRNNSRTVPKWRETSLLARAAFMGYPPEKSRYDTKRQGPKFAGTMDGSILPGDIILIARRFRNAPEVVGFGRVKGTFVRRIRGIRAPQTFGSARSLSPFVALSGSPIKVPLMDCLARNIALAKLHPETNSDHKALCDWMDSKLSLKGSRNGGVVKLVEK